MNKIVLTFLASLSNCKSVKVSLIFPFQMRWEWLFESDAKFNLMLNDSHFTPNIEEEKSPVYKYKNNSLRFVSIDYYDPRLSLF